MAYLKIRRGRQNYSCGGFLVSENFVLTAAHCNGDEITVYLGAHDKRKRLERSQQEIPTHNKIPHPQYDEDTYNNDILLLQLDRRVALNTWVKTIPLPGADQKVQPRDVCSTAGWGRVCPQCEWTPNTLQEVEVEVLEDEGCQTYRGYNASTMLCAGDPRKGKDSAKGDSGGPLVCRGIAQGIVSWGFSTPPGVYTRVSTFIPWIEKMMKKLQP